MASEDDDFLAVLRAAALRARASGFLGTADAIDAIVRTEISRRAGETPLPNGRDAHSADAEDEKR